MATTKQKPLDTQAGIELYIMELATEYKVSDRFLVSVIPKIKDIFALNIPAEQRDSLLALAEKSFKLQADTEAVLNTVAALAGSLKGTESSLSGSRRKPRITSRIPVPIKTPIKTRSVN